MSIQPSSSSGPHPQPLPSSSPPTQPHPNAKAATTDHNDDDDDDDDDDTDDTDDDDDDDDQDWGDWVEDQDDDDDDHHHNHGSTTAIHVAGHTPSPNLARSSVRYHALFPHPTKPGHLDAFPSPDQALLDAKRKGCDVLRLIRRLELDPLQVIRLFNHLRRHVVLAANHGVPASSSSSSSAPLPPPPTPTPPPTPQRIANLTADELLLHDDAELVPVPGFEDDGMLQIDFDEFRLLDDDDDDDDDEAEGAAADDGGDVAAAPSDEPTTRGAAQPHRQARRRIVELEQEVASLRLAYQELQSRHLEVLGIGHVREDVERQGDRHEVDGGGGCGGGGNEARQAGAAATRVVDASSSAAAHNNKARGNRGPIAGVSRTHPPVSGAPTTAASQRDEDDMHYFTSYASHDIHHLMVSDAVRTVSYAQFLLHPSNAHLVRGKVVMDVGCGTGVLSLLAARAGARRVVAVDASEVAVRCESNVAENGWGDVVRVVRGKVEELDEELEEYRGKVDLIVSEWMGYFLLYECMLPSVLYARDRYLRRDTGVLAPSHCRMTLAAVTDPVEEDEEEEDDDDDEGTEGTSGEKAERETSRGETSERPEVATTTKKTTTTTTTTTTNNEETDEAANAGADGGVTRRRPRRRRRYGQLLEARRRFWSDVYGFGMSAMAQGLECEAWTEALTPRHVVSDVADIYDLPLQVMVARQPSFVSPFVLRVDEATTVHGFASWFDTWFMPDTRPWPSDDRKQLRGGEKLDLPACRLDPIQAEEVPALVRLRGSQSVVDLEESGEGGTGEGRGGAEVGSGREDDKAQGHVVSFTTGPYGQETHWKQTVFLLKEPLDVEGPSEIHGEIHVTPSTTHARELDVEIHYELRALTPDRTRPSAGGAADADVDAAGSAAHGKRRIATRLVQLFYVR